MFGLILLALGTAVLCLALWVRLAPSDPAVWNVDPLTVTPPDKPNHYLLRPGAGSEQPIFEGTPQEVLTRFEQVALSHKRVHRLAVDPAQGLMTFVARSALWGFPDYVSVKAVSAEGGTALAIYARARFGYSDMGVNRARITGWLEQMAAR